MSGKSKDDIQQTIESFYRDLAVVDQIFMKAREQGTGIDAAEQDWLRSIRARFDKESSTFVKYIDEYLDQFAVNYGKSFSPRYNPSVDLTDVSPGLKKLLLSDSPLKVQAGIDTIKEVHADTEGLYHRLRTIEPLHPLYYMLTAKTKLWPQVEVSKYSVDLLPLAVNNALMIRHFYANPTESVARALSFSMGVSLLDLLSIESLKKVDDFAVTFDLNNRSFDRATLSPADDIIEAMKLIQSKSYGSLKRVPAYNYFYPLTGHHMAWLHAFCAAELHLAGSPDSRDRFLRQQGMTVYCSISIEFAQKLSPQDILTAIQAADVEAREAIRSNLFLAKERVILDTILEGINSRQLTDLSREHVREKVSLKGYDGIIVSSLKVIKEYLNFSKMEEQCIRLVEN